MLDYTKSVIAQKKQQVYSKKKIVIKSPEHVIIMKRWKLSKPIIIYFHIILANYSN
jgi:hypothetical protein